MKLIGVIAEDFVNYKEPCMTLEMPFCSFKCDKENGNQICQNGALACAPRKDINDAELIHFYLKNDIVHALCFQGLEPFDSADLLVFINEFRSICQDKIIIYTGYTEEEVTTQFSWIYNYHNIIIKYGRFIPNQTSHYDTILGVNLASNNQYAKEYI